MTIPQPIADILRTLEDAAAQAVIVGGAVRGLLTGNPPHDYDIATSLTPDRVSALFERTIPTGVAHGTVTVLHGGMSAEVTTFRRDGEYDDHRRPQSVEWSGDLEQDLARRDFTIGAIALDLRGKLFDPFGGVGDLRDRVIRAVGDPDRRFGEDALRMLRALRLATEGYTIEPKTLMAIERNAPLCRHLSPERIASELRNTLESTRPERALDMLRLGLLCAVLPPTVTPNVTAHQPTVNPDVTEQLRGLPPSLRFAAFARFATRPNGRAADLAVALRCRRDVIADCRAVDTEPLPSTRADWKRLFCRLGDRRTLAVAAAGDEYSEAADIVASGEPRNLSMLAINGDDILEHTATLQPTRTAANGVTVGDALRRLFDRVAERPEDNSRQTLLRILNEGCQMCENRLE